MGEGFQTAESSELAQERPWNDRRSTTITDYIIEALKHNCLEGDPQVTICLTVRHDSLVNDQASISLGRRTIHPSIWYSELDVDVNVEKSELNTRITELLINTLPQSNAGSTMMILELDLWWCGIINTGNELSSKHDGEEIAWHNFNLGLYKTPRWVVHAGKHSVNLSLIFGDYPRAECWPRKKKIELPWCSWKEPNTLAQLTDGASDVQPKSHHVREWIMKLEDFEEEGWRLKGW